jgi:hypothetical protein
VAAVPSVDVMNLRVRFANDLQILLTEVLISLGGVLKCLHEITTVRRPNPHSTSVKHDNNWRLSGNLEPLMAGKNLHCMMIEHLLTKLSCS